MARLRGGFSRFRLPFSLILGFVLLIFLGDAFRFFEAQELGFLDLRFRLRGARPPHPDVVIVEIDDSSINRMGHWPWPRSYHAALLNALSSYRPRVILYDVLFTEASTQPEDDELLAQTIQRAGNVILAFFFQSEEPFLGVFPLASFRKAARAIGFVNIFPDADGHIRRIRLRINPKEGAYYHSSVLAVLGRPPDEKQVHSWLEALPLDREKSLWIDYPGEFSLFQRIPVSRVIEEAGSDNAELRALIQGKILVLGQTATGGGDFRPTPFSPVYPGVGIEAAAIHTLLTGQYLRRFEGWFPFGILLLLTLVVTFLTLWNPPLIALATVILLTGFYLVWNFVVFCRLGWILPVFPVLLAIFGTYVLVLFFQYVQIRFEGELRTRELSWAARIQENFLPQESPQMKGLDVGFQCRFAQMVGGDLYDWVLLGASRIGICVGDVSGKGVPAALYMARVISEWRSLAKDFSFPSDLMSALNKRLVALSTQGIFVTLLYLIFDLDSKTILFSNAGHEPLFFYRNRERKGDWIRTGGAPPLGLFPDTPYVQETLSFEEGDFAVLISDGVRELRNPRGEEWGLRGMEKAFDSFPRESADETVKHLFRGMEEFSRGIPAHDDRTLVCVRIGKGGKG